MRRSSAKKVVVQTFPNLTTLIRLNKLWALKLNIVEAKDHSDAFKMVAERKADAFAMDDVLLFGLRAASENPKLYTVIGKPMTIEPYAIMLPKGDKPFKEVVDREMRRLIYSGEIYKIYERWFEQAIPPKGINLNLPMSALLKSSFKYPSDKVSDLVD